LIDAKAELTGHPQIRKAREPMPDNAALSLLLSELTQALGAGDRTRALDVLQALVPEYAAAKISVDDEELSA
jgi:hypothetical protein